VAVAADMVAIPAQADLASLLLDIPHKENI
jgi:hypothetical protein